MTSEERDGLISELRAHLAYLDARRAHEAVDAVFHEPAVRALLGAHDEARSRLADERARGLEDAAYLTASVSDAEVFRAQAARLRGTDVGSPVRRPLAGVPTPPLGERASVIARVEDHDHHLVIAMYRFHDGTERPYVEVHESHDPPGPARVLPLPEAVHLMQNASLDELHSIGGREVGVLYGADSTHETARARSRAVLYPFHGIGAEVPYDADEAERGGTR